MPPKRTRGTSHKKNNILVSTIKIENAAIVKKARLAKHPTRTTVPSTNCLIIYNEDDANETTTTITPAVAINSPPSRRKKTSNSYYKVTNHRLNLSFRSYSKIDDNYVNMLPHISKEINGNFNVEYKRRTTSQRRSNRNLHLQSDNQSIVSTNNNDKCSTELVDTNTTTTTEYRNDLILSNYIRCYVEDFMIRTVGEQILVLLPSRYSTMAPTKWSPLFDSDIHSIEVLFTQAKYSGYIGVVCTNPLIDNVSSGMHLSDYDLGF